MFVQFLTDMSERPVTARPPARPPVQAFRPGRRRLARGGCLGERLCDYILASLCVLVSVCLYVRLSLCLSFSLSVCLSVRLSGSLSLSLSPSLSASMYLSLSLPPSLSARARDREASTASMKQPEPELI